MSEVVPEVLLPDLLTWKLLMKKITHDPVGEQVEKKRVLG